MQKFKTKLAIAWIATIVLLLMTIIMMVQNFYETTLIQVNRYFIYLFFYILFVTDFIFTLPKKQTKNEAGGNSTLL